MSNKNLLKKAKSQISDLTETLNQLSFQIQSLDNGLITNDEFKSSLEEIKPEIKFLEIQKNAKFNLTDYKSETRNFIEDLERYINYVANYKNEVYNDETSDERLKQIQVEVDNFINKIEK
jgi:predicted RNase H-like nuclease